jgi:wyosine [tRNA(Phe)-imidazoG37] synthetase (radical SAM superfamily)
MAATGVQYYYGPVPSRRLGRSLGINNIPAKVCSYTGDIEKDLLSITAVHPMRKEAVEALLARAGAPWEVVERLVAQGDLRETNYDGYRFYLRRFNFFQDRDHL